MLYLKIENKGVAPHESFTLFGATSKRTSTNPLVIGTFGSGAKMAVGTLLRSHINPQVFCGLTKMEFFTKPVVMQSTSGPVTHKQVCVKLGGKLPGGGTVNRTEDLSFVLDYGTRDWNDIGLALREFVSNAIDGQIDTTGDFDGVSVEVVDESKVRAKDGYTRVFVPLTEKVQEFYSNLGRWFLHFSEPEVVRNGTVVLPKAGRNKTEKLRPVIYRRGVYVREFMATDRASLFDYNLHVELNEARTFNDWEAKREAAVALRDSGRDVIGRIFLAMQKGEDVWELTLDEYGLIPSSWESDPHKERRAEEWSAAADMVFGTNAVLCDGSHNVVGQMVERKGYTPVPVKNKAWIDAAKQNGVKTDEHVLTQDDRAGRTYSDATPAVIEVSRIIWDYLDKLGMTNGKSMPKLGCFYQPVECESQTRGLYRPEVETAYAHTDIAGTASIDLFVVMVEELAHHISGATDFSRDFQTLLVRIIAGAIHGGLPTA